MKIPSFLLYLLVLCLSSHAQSNPAKPRTDWNFDDAANLDALPRVPDGFSVTMFAREPLLRNASSIAFDARGRMFVSMGPQYRNPTPKTPPDSVLLVKDTDGDGVADQSLTFATGFNCVQGLAWHGRDLWVANAPDLTIVRDLDGDDVADEYVRVFTDLGNIEHGLHGLNWAPDGRLYMTKGNSKGLAMKEAVQDEPERIAPKPFRELAGFPGPVGAPDFPAPETFTRDTYKSTYQDPQDDWGEKGGVVRCDDLGANLEIVSRGLRNPYGIAFDDGFEWLGTDQDQNEGDRLFMPFYSADFGWSHAWSTHWTGADHLPTAPVSGPVFTGSGTGVIYADSPAWPAAYRGVWLINDWLLKSTQLYRTDWKGALMQPAGGQWEDFVSAKETGALYRPVDMAFGADGALYIVGWSRGYGVEWDKDGQMSNEGRVYRIMPTGAKSLPPPSAMAFVKMTVPQLIAEFDSLLPVRRIDAQDELARRGKDAQPELLTAWKSGTLSRAQETWALWALNRAGGEDELFARIAADVSSPLNPRLQALRILGHRKSGILETVIASALADKEARVRFAAVQAVHQGRLAALAEPLIAHAAVEKDRLTYYATWHALRDLAGEDKLRPLLQDKRGSVRCAALLALLDLQAMPKAELHPFVHDEDETVRGVAALGLGIGTRPDPKAKLALAPPFALATKITSESGRDYQAGTLRDGQPSYTDRKYVFKQVPESLRDSPMIRTANEDDRSRGNHYLTFDLALESTVIVAHDMRLKERPAWLRDFADTDQNVVTDDTTFHLWSKDFPVGKVSLGGNWDGKEPRGFANYFVILQPKPLPSRTMATTEEAVLAAMREAKPFRGEALFFLSAACATCHRIGERGINFGPNLTNLGDRLQAKFIVQAMLEPNAVITEGFSAHVVEAAGANYFGMLLSSGKTLKLGLVGGQTVELAADTITKHETLPVSPMPSFSAVLGPQDVADITAWLLAQKSAPSTITTPLPPSPPSPPTTDDFQVGQRADSLSISWQGRAVGDYVFRDAKIQRPYFARLHAPDGTQVTRNFPPVEGLDATDHDTMHPGLALAFGDLNGVDFWRNKGRIGHVRFIREPRVEGGRLSFVVEEKYLAPDGIEVCRGTSEFCFVAGDTLQPALPGTLLMWNTTLRRVDGPLTFGPQHEMGLGLRMATPLVVKGGTGSILSSHGGENEVGNWGRIGTWWDYTGTTNGSYAGVLVCAATDNPRPVWSHARDYGFLAMNPTGPPPGVKDVPSLPFTVPAGEALRLKFGVLLHASPEPMAPAKAASAVSGALEAWK
jgi:putative membrane-bound dehydrogenase-like protein